jgi:hypothetical protein
MSVTFEIGCLDCKKKLWIGQAAYIYNAQEKLDRFATFLLEHREHHLVVATEHMEDLEECEDIEGSTDD